MSEAPAGDADRMVIADRSVRCPRPGDDHDAGRAGRFERRQFRMNWHLAVIAARLAAVKDGRIRRLMINLPPRHRKLTRRAPCPASSGRGFGQLKNSGRADGDARGDLAVLVDENRGGGAADAEGAAGGEALIEQHRRAKASRWSKT
jgi:hypothetical protein